MGESYELGRVYTDEEFVTHWLNAYYSGKSARDVAEEMGLSTKDVYYRVDKLRGEGVDLPNFRERILRANQSHIAKLNDMIKDFKPKSREE